MRISKNLETMALDFLFLVVWLLRKSPKLRENCRKEEILSVVEVRIEKRMGNKSEGKSTDKTEEKERKDG